MLALMAAPLHFTADLRISMLFKTIPGFYPVTSIGRLPFLLRFARAARKHGRGELAAPNSFPARANPLSMQDDMKNRGHPRLRPLKFLQSSQFIWCLLFCSFLLMCYLVMLVANSLPPARDAPRPAAAGGTAIGYAIDAVRERQQSDEDRTQAYTAWLRAAHARAAAQGR